MSKRRENKLEAPVAITCSVHDWMHLALVAASGRETLAECEGVLLESEHVQGQLAAVDRCLEAIHRALKTVDSIDL